MKKEFTKGEWYVAYDTIQIKEGKIAEVCTENDVCKKNWQANAKLIAAAPEMYEALIDILRILELNPTNDNLYQRNKITRLISKI